jgi:hypothetical protein
MARLYPLDMKREAAGRWPWHARSTAEQREVVADRIVEVLRDGAIVQCHYRNEDK